MTKPGTTVSFTYDALGARKTKTVNGTTTRYLTAQLFGMSRVLAELDTSMNIKATYVYGGHQLLKEEPVAADPGGEGLYLLADGIVGSITHAVDSNGLIKGEYSYDAFGIRTELSAGTPASHGHYGYTGQEYDEETGLLYLRARYYDPMIGRFISADPFWGRLNEPVSQNRYTYVHNNPLMYVDPMGLWVYITGHNFGEFPAASSLGHLAYLLVPDDQQWAAQQMAANPGLWAIGGANDGVASGQIYTTISAGPNLAAVPGGMTTYLDSTPLRPSDAPSINQVYDVLLPPLGGDDRSLITSLLEADASYRAGSSAVQYWFVPIGNMGSNSNSYISGLGDYVGGRYAGPHQDSGINFVGFDSPVPRQYFGSVCQ